MAIHSIELFAGVGMLGEGARAALQYLGIELRTLCYVEREAAAAAQLVTLMEAGILDTAPVWSDVTTFRGQQFRGAVDCIIAGFPCQDLSVAGKRAGLDGKRSGLFFHILDIAEDCGAWFLVLENVSGIASATATVVDKAASSDITGERYRPPEDDPHGEDGAVLERAAARVVGELADRGWSSEWITLSASDVGASHGRERWFCIAWRKLGSSNCPRRQTSGSGCPQHPGCELESPGSVVDDTQRQQFSGKRVHEGSGAEGAGTPDAHGASCSMADASGEGLEGCEQRRPCSCDRGGQEAHGSTSELCGALPLFAPGPEDPIWGDIIEQFPWLSPATEPGVRLLADGMALLVDESRSHQIREVGNGVVPLQAAAAIVTLVRRAGIMNSIITSTRQREAA